MKKQAGKNERKIVGIKSRTNLKFSLDSVGPGGPERVACVLLQRLLRRRLLRRLRKWKTCSATRPTTLIARAAAVIAVFYTLYFVYFLPIFLKGDGIICGLYSAWQHASQYSLQELLLVSSLTQEF